VAVDQQTSATTPSVASAAPPNETPANDVPPLAEASTATSASRAATAGEQPPSAEQPQAAGFGSRGRLRRRARFLRKARELAYRDLGGLVFNLHHFRQRNDALVLAKLDTLGRIDAELRALEASLSQRQAVTVLREAGITACPRCAAIHSSEDRFCPGCGLSMSRKSDLPIAGAASATPTPAASAPPSAPDPAQPVAPPDAATATPPAPAPSHPAPTPATQAFDAVPPRDAGAPAGSQAPAREDDQPTEIIRPPAASS
jgi:hypothetical protein